MKESNRCLSVAIIGLLSGMIACSGLRGAAADQPANFTQIHSHNDYLQKHPLVEALRVGVRSVEADVNLVDGKLLVAHSLKETKPDLTLESMYLDPLRKRITDNHGSVYGDGKPIVLLVEEKTGAGGTYPVLRKVLEGYSTLLTHYANGQTTPGAITVIITGHEPSRRLLATEADRIVACDGALDDLSRTPSPAPDLVPWISSNWDNTFTWKGIGSMPDDQRQKLLAYIAQAHQQHRAIRFWEAPDNQATWAELQNDRVDWINTDHLAACSEFLASHPMP